MDDENDRFSSRERMSYLRPMPFWRRYLWQIITTVRAALLLFTLLTPHLFVPPKTGGVLCQSSSSDNWKGWPLRSVWKRLCDVLLNDGSNCRYHGRPALRAAACCQPQP